jgi:hypothetical protein
MWQAYIKFYTCFADNSITQYTLFNKIYMIKTWTCIRQPAYILFIVCELRSVSVEMCFFYPLFSPENTEWWRFVEVVVFLFSQIQYHSVHIQCTPSEHALGISVFQLHPLWMITASDRLKVLFSCWTVRGIHQ